MAETTPVARGISMDEMELLSNFSTLIKARQFEKNVKVTKLVLSFTQEEGFTIDLQETSNIVEPSPEA